MNNNFVKREIDAFFLAQLASNPTEWKKKYGTKTLAEVLAKSEGVEGLIRAGVGVEDAVQICGTSNGIIRGVKGNNVQVAQARIRKSTVQKPARKHCIVRKADGTSIELIQRGDKMVVVGGRKNIKK